jgi:CHAD domain
VSPRHELTATGSGPAGEWRAGSTAGAVLGGYLNGQAAVLLRSLRPHHEGVGSAETVLLPCRAACRISGTLYTFRPLLDPRWADQLSAELSWLSGVLAREHACAARLDRLLAALHRLSSPAAESADRRERTEPAGQRGIGSARAGALLERQLTLARTKAHSAALRALGSARFHAVADAVALLASEAPVAPDAAARAAVPTLRPFAERAHRRLAEAVDSLPPGSGTQALAHTLTTAEGRHDAAWHRIRFLVRLARYAQEVLDQDDGIPGLTLAGHHLNRHRDAAEAAAAAATAGRTPRIAPATAYALGVLHADQRHDAEAARFAFCRTWRPGGEAADRG